MVVTKKENEKGEFIMEDVNPAGHIPHPKNWADSLPDLKRRNADLDKRDNLSWANESPYNLEGAFGREFDRMYYGEDFMKEQETRGAYKPSKFFDPLRMKSALDSQIGGTHYGDNAIQPIEFITKNKLSFVIGSIIKYAVRADKKGGAEDLMKIVHYCQIELETKYGIRSEVKYQE